MPLRPFCSACIQGSPRLLLRCSGAQIALEVALGLHYLHRNYILHLDLKSLVSKQECTACIN